MKVNKDFIYLIKVISLKIIIQILILIKIFLVTLNAKLVKDQWPKTAKVAIQIPLSWECA